MPKSAFEPCIPTRGTTVPDRPEWIHEIKHDGYRLIIQRDGKRVRLWTRNGHDWSDRFPLITEAALRNRNSSFVLDGEAVLLGVDGRSDFNGLHSRRHDHEVRVLRLRHPGERRRGSPQAAAVDAQGQPRPAAGAARDGIFLSDFEQGEIGPDLFRHACLMGLEGMVSKHRESLIAAAGSGTGSRSRTGNIRRSPACRISSVSAACGLFNLDPGCCPLAIAGERFALIESNCRCWGPNGVSEWVWRAGALRM